MLSTLWRHTPGNAAVKTVVMLVVAAGGGIALWYAVFPLLAEWLYGFGATVK